LTRRENISFLTGALLHMLATASTAKSPTSSDNYFKIQSRNYEDIQSVRLCVRKALIDSLFCTCFWYKFAGGYGDMNKRYWVAFEVGVA
jgi:hypothetical protein